MRKWTDSQKDAIHARNASILVSAAAGSGKTSVLIERLMALLRGGASVERMLVVTFTNAAANDMRERLLEALGKEARGNRHLRTQHQAVMQADIGTLHSFCSRLVKRYFQAVGADPGSLMVDAGSTGPLLDDAINDEMEALYKSPGEDGQCLIDQYQDTQIDQMVRTLYTFFMAQDDPWGWAERQLDMPQDDVTQQPWYPFLLRDALEQAETAVSLAQQNLALCGQHGGPARYLACAQTDLEMTKSILAHLQAHQALPPAYNPVFDRLPSTKAPPDELVALNTLFKDQRKACKAALAACGEALPGDPQAQAHAAEDVAYTQPALRALVALVRRVHDHYTELKVKKQYWDFSDVEHLALSCLKDPVVLTEVHAQYDALFVDEYQDISRIQEAIISAMHGPGATLFMVGDVKQSIYRFRLAEPGLFMHKYERFSPHPDAAQRIIHLSENFRSRGNILRAVNHVFAHALQGKKLEIDYDSDAALKPGLKTMDDPPVELHIITPPDENAPEDEDGEQLDATQKEAALLAERILQLKGTHIGEGESRRPASFRDMVILLRSASGRASKMAEVLQSFGIPVYSEADRQFFDVQEVQDLLTLLAVLDNPYDDEKLLSALSAPPFQWDDMQKATLALERAQRDELLHQVFFRLAQQPGPARDAMLTMDNWRFQSEHTQLDIFLRRLLRETGLYTLAGAKPQGALRRGNLRLLCERAAPNPEPQTLHGFLRRVKEARRQDTAKSAATLGASEDVVRIMTVHKSKGLEFPIVFLPDLAHRFRLHSQGEMLLMDPEAGMALRKVDPHKRMSYWTMQGKAIQSKHRHETRSEEARLLYVAMTRAQERLVMMAAPAKVDTARKSWRAAGEHAAKDARCMMDWVGQSLWPALQLDHDSRFVAPDGGVFNVYWRPADTLQAGLAAEQQGPIPPAVLPVSEETERAMAPLAPPASHPLKLSVTQLARRLQEVEEETAFTKRRAYEEEGFVLPPAGSREQSIERGLATHRALSAVRLEMLKDVSPEALPDALKAELDALHAQGVLSGLERGAIDEPRVVAFFSGELGQRLLRARQVQREWPFSLLVEHGLVLQGVLDCCFLEEDAWVLMDYKTDRAPAADILTRYHDQMRWYMRALRDITGMPVKEAWLYALRRGEAIAVQEQAPITFGGTL